MWEEGLGGNNEGVEGIKKDVDGVREVVKSLRKDGQGEKSKTFKGISLVLYNK